jgi:hypothetical protein
MNDERAIPVPDTGIIFYQTEDGQSKIQVRLQDGTVWLNQRLLAELYQVAVPTINIHISTIFSDHELVPEATIRKYLIVQTEGSRQIERQVDFYNLDMILAIGYMVRSHRGVQFRHWATERLKEYIVRGFVMDDERLKGESAFGRYYFDELLERIRDIRASEKRFYKICGSTMLRTRPSAECRLILGIAREAGCTTCTFRWMWSSAWLVPVFYMTELKPKLINIVKMNPLYITIMFLGMEGKNG